MKYSKKIVAIMIIVMFALLLGCTDTAMYELKGTVTPFDSDVSITINEGTPIFLQVSAIDGSFSTYMQPGANFVVSYSNPDYTTRVFTGKMGTENVMLSCMALEYK